MLWRNTLLLKSLKCPLIFKLFISNNIKLTVNLIYELFQIQFKIAFQFRQIESARS